MTASKKPTFENFVKRELERARVMGLRVPRDYRSRLRAAYNAEYGPKPKLPRTPGVPRNLEEKVMHLLEETLWHSDHEREALESIATDLSPLSREIGVPAATILKVLRYRLGFTPRRSR